MPEKPEQETAHDGISLNTIAETLNRLENQNTFMRQQLTLLSGQVQAQTTNLETVSASLERELQRFQTGAGKHAIAVIFHKFVGDLVGLVNQIDDLVNIAKSEKRSTSESAWIESIEVLQSHFQTILEKWGCVPLEIKIGEDEFDPELHEAVDDGKDIPDSLESNIIVRITRRGWQLGSTIIQYPQVVVS